MPVAAKSQSCEPTTPAATSHGRFGTFTVTTPSRPFYPTPRTPRGYQESLRGGVRRARGDSHLGRVEVAVFLVCQTWNGAKYIRLLSDVFLTMHTDHSRIGRCPSVESSLLPSDHIDAAYRLLGSNTSGSPR